MKTSDLVTFMTFYPGLSTNHTQMCGGPLSYFADDKAKRSFELNIPSLNYSCEYRVKVTDFKFRNSGEIFIWLEKTTQVNVYIYSGTDHKNMTTLIEENSIAAVGAPYRVKLTDGAVIIAHVFALPT